MNPPGGNVTNGDVPVHNRIQSFNISIPKTGDRNCLFRNPKLTPNNHYTCI